MTLQKLFSIINDLSDNKYLSTEISGIYNDTRKMTPNSVFIATRGFKTDGHDFLTEAISRGAVALVVENRDRVPCEFDGVVIQVSDTRTMTDILAAQFYSHPGLELFCIGVTGTNGKTSITYMCEHILNFGGIRTGVIGTINHHLGEKTWSSNLTTPDSISLQARLREFREAGAMAIAMEVSSHALEQKRVDSVPFNAAVFTNLTRDHLDYHQTMQNYFQSKQRMFTELLTKSIKKPCFAIVNLDDKYGRRLKIAEDIVLWTYGSKDADFKFRILKMSFSDTEYELKTPTGEAIVRLPMMGVYNVQNSVAAIAAAMTTGLSLNKCVEALSTFSGVPGRLQRVLPESTKQNPTIFVDYAHTPDALENVLSAILEVRKKNKQKSRIITVFGCGGDRDKGKRPMMAQVALQFSDYVVVTSDNPRTENPGDIIKDIMSGVAAKNKSNVMIEEDRKKAIDHAVQWAHPEDVILIAGKGHEDYQIIGNEKKYFSDLEVARELLGGLR